MQRALQPVVTGMVTAVAAATLAACGSATVSPTSPTAVPPRVTTGTTTATTSATLSPTSPTSPATATTGATPTSPAMTTMATARPTSTVAPKPRTTAAQPSVATRLAKIPPNAAAGPPVTYPKNAPAVGAGANAVVRPIDNALWSRMVGYSWTVGCPVGRSALRVVDVNFWGFDGVRSRGSIVVATSIASKTAAAFTDLYAQQFRIRQMKPMDSSWGHNPKGPGADDYAAMTADNTSGFNCRYVGGEEASKKYSNHAYGKAIDVNDVENPYVDSSGRVYPNDVFLKKRSGPGVFTSSRSAAVRAFTSRGFGWEGTVSPPDYQHFDG